MLLELRGRIKGRRSGKGSTDISERGTSKRIPDGHSKPPFRPFEGAIHHNSRKARKHRSRLQVHVAQPH